MKNPWNSFQILLEHPCNIFQATLTHTCNTHGISLKYSYFEVFEIHPKKPQCYLMASFNLAWNIHLNFLQHSLIFLETCLKCPWNTLDTSLKLSWTTLGTPLKLPWNFQPHPFIQKVTIRISFITMLRSHGELVPRVESQSVKNKSLGLGLEWRGGN